MSYANLFKPINIPKTVRAPEYSSTFNSTNFPFSGSRGLSSPGRNENINTFSQAFFTKERSGKLKWKEIAKIDLDYLLRSNDIAPIDYLLDNLIFSKYDENDIHLISEDMHIRLVRIFQFLVEYLLCLHSKVDGERNAYESNYKQLINEATTLESHFKESQEKISSIKKENKEKDKLIKTYKLILDQKKYTEINQLAHECQLCQGKKFINYDALKNHYARRHPDNDFEFEFDGKMENKKIDSIEKNLESLRDYFDTYLQVNANENYIKLLETQRTLENNINELKNEKITLNNMEDNLEKMNRKLKKIKEKKSKTKKEEEFISTTEKLSKQINDVHAYNHQKIIKVSNDLEDFRKTVFSQLQVANDNKKPLKVSYTFQDFLEFNKFIEKKSVAAKSDLIPQNIESLNVHQKKFNAMKAIESDYSHFEENDEKHKQFSQHLNTSLSKIEIKKEKSVENAPKNHNTINNSDNEILNKLNEEHEQKKGNIYTKDNIEINEEIGKLSEQLEKFYLEYTKRDNDLHIKKLKHDDYYSISCIEKEKQETEKMIDPVVRKTMDSYNKPGKIDFDDRKKINKDNLIDFLENFKKQIEIKSHDNQLYKHYYEKMVSDMNLNEYMLEKTSQEQKRNDEKRKELVINFPSKVNSPDTSKIINKSMVLHYNKNDEIQKIQQEISNKNIGKNRILRMMKDDHEMHEFEMGASLKKSNKRKSTEENEFGIKK